MKRLIACEYCGRVTSFRAGKRVCCNLCAVKLLYARNHIYDTPYDSYQKTISQIDVPYNENSPPIKQSTDNMSANILLEAQNRLNEFQTHKN